MIMVTLRWQSQVERSWPSLDFVYSSNMQKSNDKKINQEKKSFKRPSHRVLSSNMARQEFIWLHCRDFSRYWGTKLHGPLSISISKFKTVTQWLCRFCSAHVCPDEGRWELKSSPHHSYIATCSGWWWNFYFQNPKVGPLSTIQSSLIYLFIRVDFISLTPYAYFLIVLAEMPLLLVVFAF